MIYLIPRNYDGLDRDTFGFMTSQENGNSKLLEDGFYWAADNNSFSGKFNERLFFNWLEFRKQYISKCLFVCVPDVVGDAKKTIDLYQQYAPRVRELGYKTAFIGQDGLENYGLRDDFDAFFIGGSTKWKLSKAARELAQEAKLRGKWLHMGRVNSLARIHYAESIGCDSVDGTHIIFEPRRASIRLIAWMNQKSLFLGGY